MLFRLNCELILIISNFWSNLDFSLNYCYTLEIDLLPSFPLAKESQNKTSYSLRYNCFCLSRICKQNPLSLFIDIFNIPQTQIVHRDDCHYDPHPHFNQHFLLKHRSHCQNSNARYLTIHNEYFESQLKIIFDDIDDIISTKHN